MADGDTLPPPARPDRLSRAPSPPAGLQADSIEQRIGYRFQDRRLLDEALTHSSSGRLRRRARRTNERLEFLGDRVLGLAVAELLIHRYPDDDEGALSPRLSVLVSEPVLAEVARALDLGSALTVARSEEEGGGRAKPAILADALEAVIGAIFLDGGWPAASEVVRRQFEPRLSTMLVPPRDAKSSLQEWTQARGLGLPVYEVLRAEGPPHAPTFEVAVRVPAHEPVTARAASKRAAEQAAAEALIARLAISLENGHG